MERLQRHFRLAMALALGGSIGWLASLAEWLPPTLLAPLLPDQRIERMADGFAISLPPDWEYAVAGEVDPEAWWDTQVVGPVAMYHLDFLSEGGLLVTRRRSPLAATENCTLHDFTDTASAPPAWFSLVHATDIVGSGEEDPEVLDTRTTFLDLPAGEAVRIDALPDTGWHESSYYFKRGDTWFLLVCGSDAPPDDRWQTIAESFEFLAAPRAASATPQSQRVERPEVGFAIAFPWYWQHAVAGDADPDDWWDAEAVGDTAAYHEEQLAAGLLLVAQAHLPDEPTLQACYVEDFTARAAMPPTWTSAGDAWFDLQPLREDPAVTSAEATDLDLPSGRVVRIDVLNEDGYEISTYYLADGPTWILLQCQTAGEPPDDRWLSIAKTLEFLPAEE